MYPYMYPVPGAAPFYYCCPMSNMPVVQPAEYMMRGMRELEEDRVDMGDAMPPMPQQMQGMEQQMPDTMDMSKMDMGKVMGETQRIVMMLEQHHPDILRTMTAYGIPVGQARQLLARIVQMSLMHHMMHQMLPMQDI